jgi:hypothetical protein
MATGARAAEEKAVLEVSSACFVIVSN